MKIFISHKNDDNAIALSVLRKLKSLEVEAYLDLLDSFENDGERLTKHIKAQLNDCTDIIVVMSESTRLSWWVPFEVGMAAQSDMPTASFLLTGVELPSYLTYWPRLRTEEDISKYVNIRKRVDLQVELSHDNLSAASRRRYGTPEFYRQLKAELHK